MSRNPSVSLTPQQQAFVTRLVESGRYHGVSEVMRAGLRLLEEQEERRQAVLRQIEAAVAEGLASGELAELEDVDTLIARAQQERPPSRG